MMKKIIRAPGEILKWLVDKTGSAVPDDDVEGTRRDIEKIKKAKKKIK